MLKKYKYISKLHKYNKTIINFDDSNLTLINNLQLYLSSDYF